MSQVFVSGRMRVLFDVRDVPVNPQDPDVTVRMYTCKWCGWTAVVDDPTLLPDHECRGPAARQPGPAQP